MLLIRSKEKWPKGPLVIRLPQSPKVWIRPESKRVTAGRVKSVTGWKSASDYGLAPVDLRKSASGYRVVADDRLKIASVYGVAAVHRRKSVSRYGVAPVVRWKGESRRPFRCDSEWL
ncbi:hypothetical protein DPMN_029175 [Dreissena polymorpha]|uniref:Uncharacterized protein n=1 Tax=Dreissena polymorpha TaxID=45954 RepID=A0A9D4LY31_DREPO|nr:hypothetical protein DPMN_029175 [Dreissena polymorpha]